MAGVARFFGLPISTIRYWRAYDGMPGEDGDYNIQEICHWFGARWKSINIVYDPALKHKPPPPPKHPPRQKLPDGYSYYPPTEPETVPDGPEGKLAAKYVADLKSGEVNYDKYRALNERNRYRLSELAIKEQEGELVRQDVIKSWLGRLAGIIRGFADVMERNFGPDGVDVHNELCDRILEQVPESEGDDER